MSGHSKWKQIKHKKASTDSKRGAVFTKLARLVTVAAIAGGADPETNFRLRLALDKAREVNLPKDNIERAIEKAAGSKDSAELHEMTFEIFGPANAKIIAKAVTDNKNRTNSDVKHLLTKNGCSIGTKNSVAWMFDVVGELQIRKQPSLLVDDITLLAIDCGAQDIDVETDNAFYFIFTLPTDLAQVRASLEEKNVRIESAQIIYKPKEIVEISSTQDQESIQLILDDLDSNDDITELYFNTRFPS